MDEFLDYFSFDGDGHLPCLELNDPSDPVNDSKMEPDKYLQEKN